MASQDFLDASRIAAEQARSQAVAQWQEQNPALAHSESHRHAFLAGYEAAAGPLPPSNEELLSRLSHRLADEAKATRERLATLPAGTCPECEGAGKFVGALHITDCSACNGTGRVA